MNKRTFDPLKGKEVLITGGQYKGFRGKVCSIDDRQAMVEMSSICKKKYPFIVLTLKIYLRS